MGSITVSRETNEARRRFFQTIWGDQPGWVFVAEIKDKAFSETPFMWPRDLNMVLERVNARYVENNIYFCPQVFSEPRRKKRLALTCNVAWADMDAADPHGVEPEPSIVVETSPKRWQAYWRLAEPVPPEDAEDWSHRLAWAYRSAGADPSGWDLTQLLRVPLTYNFKYPSRPAIPAPEYLRPQVARSELEALERVPGVTRLVEAPVPAPEQTPDPQTVLDRYEPVLGANVPVLINIEPPGDWSSALWALECALFEAGMSAVEVFAIVQVSRCNKYKRDGRPQTDLWKDVLRAQARVEERGGASVGRIGPAPRMTVSWTSAPVLTPEEAEIVKSVPEDFIDRYQTWATERTDAAVEYHLSSALICLSGVLAQSVRIPTSADEFKLNLWCLDLADSTISRKTTAMKYGIGLLRAIDENAVTATEASAEGLLDELEKRPGQSSLFYRDEVSGLFSQFTSRDYLSGMPQTLAHLYDGTDQIRVLRSRTVRVKDPIFSFYGGGVMAKVFMICDESFIFDGFFPRFLFFFGEVDARKAKPLGPPTETQDARRYELIEELRKIKDRYDLSMSMRLQGGETTGVREPWKATLTPETWERFNMFESQLLAEGNASDVPYLYVPMFARLSISTLKVATILAAARQDPNDHNGVIVELPDLLKAMGYASRWRDNAIKVVRSVGKTSTEKMLDAIIDYVTGQSGGVSRSDIMRRFRLSAKEAAAVLETLEQRQVLVRLKYGKTEIISIPKDDE